MPARTRPRDELLRLLGFTNVQFFPDLPNKVRSADQNSGRPGRGRGPATGLARCGGMTRGRWPGTLNGMTQSDHEAREDFAELLAAVGITVTEEGKARARARLDEAEARWTPERWAALREQLGLPARAA